MIIILTGTIVCPALQWFIGRHEMRQLARLKILLCLGNRQQRLLIYEMPPTIKPIPVNAWVFEIRERLESVYKFVRKHKCESMKRHKTCHDMKLSDEVYESGDIEYVCFFPVRKVGSLANIILARTF